MPPSVLLAEHDQDRAAELQQRLEALDLRVQRAATGSDALQLQGEADPDLVVVSLDLPDLHGFDVCRRLRRTSDVPLIVLGERATGTDRVLALELGADDFVGSACDGAEFQERVKAALRRAEGVDSRDGDGGVLDFGDIVIDRNAHTLTVGDRAEELTPMEMELMWTLGRHAGEVMASEDLLQDVWGYPPDVRTRTLDVHIGRLRKKLGEDGRNPRHIITIRSVGYRFEPHPDDSGEDGVAA
ncbi:MAG: response regulator transcription factor [Armatimonadota bacterium]|nr:response regulator transcription factor [Armatimonadota bacterium]